jgi:shikimate dehydrogenase
MPRSFLLPLVGCFGQPVAENPTQVMVEAGFASLGLDWRYITTEVAPAGLADAVAGARAMGFVGFNCTIPHKVAVIEHLDGLGESARIMQAVNCVVRRGDQFIGENTDGKGFVEAVKRTSDVVGANVTLIGAGGAARAIAVELALAGIARLRVINRSRPRAVELQTLIERELPSVTVELVPVAGASVAADLLVNATPVGLYPNVDERLPIDLSQLTPETIVADVVFNPPTTKLIADAQNRGCLTVDGLEMLVGQGVIGIELWTGQTPDASAMRTALAAALSL